MVRAWKEGESKYKYPLRVVPLEEALEIVESVPKRFTIDRDKAMISFTIIFGKRALENLMVKKEHVWLDSNFFYVRFRVLKKKRRRKICENCGEKNPLKANLCAYCGSQNFRIEEYGESFTERVKHKAITHPLSEYFLDWWKKVPPKSFVFPPLNKDLVLQGIYEYLWSKSMTYVRMWQIFHEIANISPHGFRHSLATKLAETGEYDELDLLYWFDWETFETARKYIHLGGGKRVRKIAKFMG